MSATENRLTDSDRDTITARLAEVVEGYGGPYRPTWADAPTLERIAVHAIGCSADDLRDRALLAGEKVTPETGCGYGCNDAAAAAECPVHGVVAYLLHERGNDER